MRDLYWDILKGLGIVAVVMGHAGIFTMEVNWFHLELFFFVSGFLFKAEKCLDYGNFFCHKLKTLWKPFVMYNVIFFVLHDFFIFINWINTSPKEGVMVADWISLHGFPYLISQVIFTGLPETMCLPTWFMAPFFVNLLWFAYLVKVTYNKSAWQLPVLLSLFFVVGVVLVNYSPKLTMYSDMAMFLLPITAAGFYLRKFCYEKNINVSEIFSTRIAIGGGGITSVILFALMEYMSPDIILGQYKIGNWFIFMVAAFSGICLTMILARIILLSDLLTKIFAFIGRKSFHIMALHFVGFKILTSLYVISEGAHYHFMSYYIVNEIPTFLYLVFGVGIPLILCKIYDSMKRRFYES